MRDMTTEEMTQIEKRVLTFLDAQKEGERILSVRKRYPNLLDFIGQLAAQISLIEPAFHGDIALCVPAITHATTVVAQAIALLEQINETPPLGIDP